MGKRVNRQSIVTLIGVLLVYAIVQGAIFMDALPPFVALTLIQICIYIILATSLNLINGITGQFSIGHAGFMAIGAYMAAIVVVKFHGPLILALLAGAAVSALAGFLIGLPTLRLKGDYLAIATLGFGEIVRIIFLNTEYVGGASGFSVPKTITWTWAFWLTVVSIIIIRNFIYSTHGRACISIRENEIAADVMGINTTKYKIMAFTIGAFFAGLAGGIYANYLYIIQPLTFSFLKSFDILVMVVLGGLGSLTGSVLGAIVMTVVSAVLSGWPEWRLVITAILLIVMMIFRPTGLLGTKEFSLSFLGKKGDKNASSKD
ncbi:ABC-type branched-chain amino acid transport system, permease component [Desulfosporosinus orientis DSM 765]|uniref:ABC-type branched-chain amino acid transport system, permease component n=1 Tax=Desulfosporosinus orientis (strain ATCC 19365 / DSM 765 / NCIMB 8382 / VKM B-1628 / Singapore I) TaxID=768706 RepID=G7WI66_DESOD|nr:branched-chain amino acid ABC transporter permease [Desulfosporosinus orientis]AET70989.1 ABC-type branched-chain amino acid transport system, permease component [Desulfosporosinus orientis DSM 765]